MFKVSRVGLAFTLTLGLALMASACSSGSSPNASKSGSNKTFHVAYSTYAGGILFYRATIDGLKDGAAQYGIRLTVTDSNFDAAKQVSDIETGIAQKPDFILVSPGDATALIPAYRAAKDANIPIASFGDDISDQSLRVFYYAANYTEINAARTEAMLAKMGFRGKIAAIRGPAAVSFVKDYTVGSNSVFKKHPGIKVVFDQNAPSFAPADGLRLAQDALTAHPDLNGIYIDDDETALGVLQALKERNIDPKSLVISSSDGINLAMHLVQQGKLENTLVTLPYQWGRAAMTLIHDYLVNGTKPPSTIQGPTVIATAQNVDQLLAECPKHPKEQYCRTGA
jgi:ribose transport system substrate-binding protein